jgi:hypothetical protein
MDNQSSLNPTNQAVKQTLGELTPFVWRRDEAGG